MKSFYSLLAEFLEYLSNVIFEKLEFIEGAEYLVS